MASLYAPYKAVGYVTDGFPFAVNHLGTERFLTTSIGTSFQVYRLDRLTVCLVSKNTPSNEKISCLQVLGHETFCGVGKDIVVYNRSDIVRVYRGEESEGKIMGLHIVGNVLVSYDDACIMKVIDVKERVVISIIKPLNSTIKKDKSKGSSGKYAAAGVSITSLMHPATYVNKFVVGYSNGIIELWNVRSQKIIHSFQSHISCLKKLKETNSYGMDNDSDLDDDGDFICPAVTCIEQSPATDVVAVGFTSGDILIMNLKLDKVLFFYKQDMSAVTSLSFRTDSSADKYPYLVSGGSDGRLHVWNLGVAATTSDGIDDADEEETIIIMDRKLECSIQEAHMKKVGRVHFLYGEPVMISCSQDNTLKMWIFDSADGAPRIFKTREGHSGIPVRIRYYGGMTSASMRDNAEASSCEIISAGTDGTVRLFNTAVESQNREMSQKVILKKFSYLKRNARLPLTIGFDFSETRQRDWANMATIHENHSNVYLWRYKKRSVTNLVLKQPSWNTNEMSHKIDVKTHSTAVALSSCGNFCIVGSKGGVIYKYNVQSGLNRGAYPKSSGESAMKEGTRRIRSSIPGNVLYEHRQIMGNEDPRLAQAGSLQSDFYNNFGTKGKEKKSGDGSDGADMAREEMIGHTSKITGLFIDAMNTTMVSCGSDGYVIFWDFDSHNIVHFQKFDSSMTLMVGFKDSGFVAVAAEDNVVRIFDLATFKLSRRFPGDSHSLPITDMCFAMDGRRLLTSSLDSTVRVWDVPTGRCLAWHSFASSVLSVACSISGEFLCVTLDGREGIFMYIDRSLYESVHFWKEPTEPLELGVSAMVAERSNEDIADKDEDDDKEEEEEDDDKEEEEEENSEKGEIDDYNIGEEIAPANAYALSGAAKESSAQRGDACITFSAVPRAYWTTLFHLESIKRRNRAKAAPEAPVQAPFFLPTIIKDGSTPSFPTPLEYTTLVKSVAGSAASLASDALTTSSAAPTSTLNAAKSSTSDDAIMAELAAMGSAWEDDDDNDNDNDNNRSGGNTFTVGNITAKISRSRSNSSSAVAGFFTGNSLGSAAGLSSKRERPSSSRIITRKTAIARCKLVAYLLAVYPSGEPTALSHFTDDVVDNIYSGAPMDQIMQFLQGLPAPAVDVEIRSLCMYEGDEEGVMLLRCLLHWFKVNLRSRCNFELLQAYIHCAINIYHEIITKVPLLCRELIELQETHKMCCERFRHLVQSNLCLLKMFAGLAPI